MNRKRILVTGTAGFIGYSLTRRLLQDERYEIVGLDNINDYYDTNLKYDRLAQLGLDKEAISDEDLITSSRYPQLRFIKLNLENRADIRHLFASEQFELVVHLAAQAGVRHSLTHPHAYVDSNVTGFVNILEGCKEQKVGHLVYASSSSVYGLDSVIPFSETAAANQPVSLYAATKKMNEMMAFTYHHLYNLQVTGLRFFTVYGPWGRPDMSPVLFAKAICEGRPIKVFNHGNMRRDFTYIDDIVDGVTRVMEAQPDGCRIYNIGNGSPVDLMEFISLLEKGLGKEAIKQMLPMQPGEVFETYADSSRLSQDTGYRPATPLAAGVQTFLDWYRGYYRCGS